MLHVKDHIVATPKGRTLQQKLSFDLSAGVRLGVTGPSGCGKSTLLRQIARVAAGQGESDTITLQRIRFDYLPQGDFLFPWYSARQNYSAWVNGRGGRVLEGHLEFAKRLGVADDLDKDFSQLSGGERQRVALWSLVCRDVELAALDEPFTALDLERKIECTELLGQWMGMGKRALIVVSHDFEVLTYLCSRVLIMGRDESEAPYFMELPPNLPSGKEDYLARREAGAYRDLLKAMARSNAAIMGA